MCNKVRQFDPKDLMRRWGTLQFKFENNKNKTWAEVVEVEKMRLSAQKLKNRHAT